MKMELAGVHFVLAASGFLLLASGSSAAPMVCHFDSRGEARSSQHLIWPGNKIENMPLVLKVFVVLALCVFDGRNYSLGDSWMDNACLQCTCLHPVGVGCCETWALTQPLCFCKGYLHETIKTKVHCKHFFTLLTTQGAPACGFSCVVSGVGGAGDLQRVPGPDSGPPPALLPRWKHPGPQPRIASATAAGPGVELPLWHPSLCENKAH